MPFADFIDLKYPPSKNQHVTWKGTISQGKESSSPSIFDGFWWVFVVGNKCFAGFPCGDPGPPSPEPWGRRIQIRPQDSGEFPWKKPRFFSEFEMDFMKAANPKDWSKSWSCWHSIFLELNGCIRNILWAYHGAIMCYIWSCAFTTIIYYIYTRWYQCTSSILEIYPAQGDTPCALKKIPDGMWFLFVTVAFVCLVAAERDEYLGIELLQMEISFKSIGTDKGHCLRFMHIPKTGGTSIDAANMHQSVAPYGSLMRDTYERIATARHFDGDIGDLYENSHRSPEAYAFFLMENGQFYHMLPENASDQCEDLHTPPDRDPMIQEYYEKCETFCAIRNPLERFWSAYRMGAGKTIDCHPDYIESFVKETLQEAKERPYENNCFLVPQVEFVYGSRNWSHATQQYCTRFLHQENLTAEFDELMMEIGRPEVKLPEEELLSSWSGCSIWAHQTWLWLQERPSMNFTKRIMKPLAILHPNWPEPTTEAWRSVAAEKRCRLKRIFEMPLF